MPRASLRRLQHRAHVSVVANIAMGRHMLGSWRVSLYRDPAGFPAYAWTSAGPRSVLLAYLPLAECVTKPSYGLTDGRTARIVRPRLFAPALRRQRRLLEHAPQHACADA